MKKLRVINATAAITTAALLLGLLAIIGVQKACADPPGGTAGWTLAFDDEFNGSSLDTTKWNNSDGGSGPTFYVGAANSFVSGGLLQQTETLDSSGNYHGGWITTDKKFETVYGYMEARVKTPYCDAVWPSFWMLADYGWPPELDIFENWGGQNSTLCSQTWHYFNDSGGEQGDQHGEWNTTVPYWNGGWGADYHIYGALWKQGEIDWYIDGVKTYTSTTRITTLPMYLLLTNAMGGTAHGQPDPGEDLTQATMYVDWVKVWNHPLGTPLNRSGWTASASSSGQWWPPSNAIDGDTTTYWNTGTTKADGQWFQVDMGSPQTFNSIQLASYQHINAAPVGVSIYVSNDGQNWGSAISSVTTDSTIQQLSTVQQTFATQNARYIRVVQNGTDSSGGYWGIDDFNVYNNGSTTPTFNATASVSPSTVSPGSSVTASVTVKCTGGSLSNGIVDMELNDANGNKVAQYAPTSQTFSNGQTLTYTWTFNAPSTTGAYTIGVGVFSSDWSVDYSWQNTATLTDTAGTVLSINAGGGATGSFVADTDASGGSTYSNSDTIDTSASGSAPAAVYDSQRYGTFTYTIPVTAPPSGSSYTVKLHFAETWHGISGRGNDSGTGQRYINVSVNGTSEISNLDVYATAGAADKAVVETITGLQPDSNGNLVIAFSAASGSPDPSAFVSGIEVSDPVSATAKPAAPTGLKAVAGAGRVNASWGPVSGATSYNVYRSTASGKETSYKTSISAEFLSDSSVTKGTTYYYKVAAVNAKGTSAQSAEVSATP